MIGALGVVAVTVLFPLATGHGATLPTTIVMVVVAVMYGSKLTWVSAVLMSQAGRASAAGAAFANGTAAHALEIDDGYTSGSSHQSAATLPAVLALAEKRGAEPRQVIMAVVVAVETACRIAAAGHPETRRLGFHNTPLAGVFGAAAGAGVVLGLDATAMTHALGLAGSHAGGLFEFLGDGSDVKRLHPGKAARDGVVCAELAAAGLTGPATVLEGADGYLAAYARGRWDEQALLADLGARWVMARTYVKPYPCCRHLHSTVDAVLRLRSSHRIAPDQVDRVLVETYDIAARHDGLVVDNEPQAQLSTPYAVAAALTSGELGLREFSASARADAGVLRLASAVTVRADAEMEAAYPATRPARVTIWSRGTNRVTVRVNQPLGEPENPISDADLVAKAHRFADPALGVDRVRSLTEAVWRFDDLAPLTVALGSQAFTLTR